MKDVGRGEARHEAAWASREAEESEEPENEWLKAIRSRVAAAVKRYMEPAPTPPVQAPPTSEQKGSKAPMSEEEVLALIRKKIEEDKARQEHAAREAARGPGGGGGTKESESPQE